MTDKEKLLEQMKEEHSQALYKLEKKAVLDKDRYGHFNNNELIIIIIRSGCIQIFNFVHRMKKEMVAKVNSVAAEFRKVSDLQMAETTKRTIRENVAISTQLSKMSDRTMEIIRENERMKLKEKELKQEIEILEAQVKELSKSNINNQRVMEMLRDTAGEQVDQALEFQERALQCGMLELKVAEAGEQAEAATKEAEVKLNINAFSTMRECGMMRYHLSLPISSSDVSLHVTENLARISGLVDLKMCVPYYFQSLP